jgi:NAD-dependent dihydropyrimidine dehydrogenase PreA subunit
MPPIIERSRCIECGNCVYVCGKWIFHFGRRRGSRGWGGISRKNAKHCVHCFACQDLCPTGAIRIVLPKKGQE